MTIRSISFLLTMPFLPMLTGCAGDLTAPLRESAVIVGTIAPAPGSGKLSTASQLDCPDVVVTLNGVAVPIVLDNACAFLIDDVQPAPNLVLAVELPDSGVSGTIELDNIGAAELIEILVQTAENSLSLSVVRRATPEPDDDLPLLIGGNNVTIFLPAGVYDQALTVEGNNFTLVGESGDDCDDSSWTIITGGVVVDGNNATFRNLRFEGAVQVLGNNANFINTCIGGELIIFGNNTEFGDDDDDDDDDNDDDDDDEDEDEDEDDDN